MNKIDAKPGIKAKKNELRENVIGYIYSNLVMNNKIDMTNAFESGEYTEKEINIITDIEKKQESFIKLIQKFTKSDWSWERITPLNKAILIYGSYEMLFNDKALVIDVLVDYSKEFSPDDTYKFINSVLDKVGDYYEKNKRS